MLCTALALLSASMHNTTLAFFRLLPGLSLAGIVDTWHYSEFTLGGSIKSLEPSPWPRAWISSCKVTVTVYVLKLFGSLYFLYCKQLQLKPALLAAIGSLDESVVFRFVICTVVKRFPLLLTLKYKSACLYSNTHLLVADYKQVVRSGRKRS